MEAINQSLGLPITPKFAPFKAFIAEKTLEVEQVAGGIRNARSEERRVGKEC